MRNLWLIFGQAKLCHKINFMAKIQPEFSQANIFKKNIDDMPYNQNKQIQKKNATIAICI